MKIFVLEQRLYGDWPLEDFHAVGVFSKRDTAELAKAWYTDEYGATHSYEISEMELDALPEIPNWWLTHYQFLKSEDV